MILPQSVALLVESTNLKWGNQLRKYDMEWMYVCGKRDGIEKYDV